MRRAVMAIVVVGTVIVGCAAQDGAPPASLSPREAADELAARFPQTVAGEPLEVTTYVGDEIDFELGLPTDPAILEALGIDRSHLVYLTSAPPTTGGENDIWVTAFRFLGADEAGLVEHFLGAWEAEYPDQAERETIAGKDVLQLPGACLYLEGDTVYSLGGDGDKIAELLAALP